MTTSQSASVPRNFFTYWSGSELSALNIATVESFLFHHPEDRLVVYSSKFNEELSRTWSTKEQEGQLSSGLTLSELGKFPGVELRYVDFTATYDIPSGLSANHLGDIVRILVLESEGGVWVDLDIVFLQSLPHHFFNFEGSVLATSYQGTIACGVVFAKPRSHFLSALRCELFARLSAGPIELYQSVGPDLWRDIFTKRHDLTKEVIFFDPYLFYPYLPDSIHEFFSKLDPDRISNSLGIHWYNGAKSSRNFIESYCLSNIALDRMPNCTARLALEIGGNGLDFDCLRAQKDVFEKSGLPEKFSFNQRLHVSKGLTNVSREKFLFSLCRNRSVLHVGCADSPITDVSNNLHLKLESVSCLLHGQDLDRPSLDILRGLLKRPTSRLFHGELTLIPNVYYDVLLAPEVIEHVDSISKFIGDLETMNFGLGILTAPCVNRCRDSHFHEDDVTGECIELVHPDHNCWFSPYTIANVIRKYSAMKCVKVGYIDKYSVYAAFTKSSYLRNHQAIDLIG